jgi:hypothetical protein
VTLIIVGAGSLVYNVRSRTLTALNQVADQYAGILINAKLVIQPQHGSNIQRAQVSKTDYPIVSHLNVVKKIHVTVSKLCSLVVT